MAKGLLILVLINIVGWAFVGEIFLKYLPLERALTKIESNEYREGYKCQQFSEDLIEELKKVGIQSNLIIGEDEKTILDEDVVHAWVGIWIEPQTGEFTKNYEN